MSENSLEKNGDTPFVEKWKFTINLEEIPGSFPPSKNLILSPSLYLRNRMSKHMRYPGIQPDEDESFEPISIADLHVISNSIKEMIDDHFGSSDFECHLINYEESEGSLEIAFTVLAVMYGGVASYGSFRSGLDFLQKDIKSGISGVQGVTAKVHKKYLQRKNM